MTITTTAPTIDDSGISAPQYADILGYLKQQYASIYGPDVYLEDDSMDGQFLAVIAKAISDTNQAALAIYHSFSPSTASGAALSNNVKINGIMRHVSSYSTVDLLLFGQAGTTITNGVVQDANGINWQLPGSVVIPPQGQIEVTALCAQEGSVLALPGTVKIIKTPTLGWQSVTNPSASTLGNPIESDAALRGRQAQSTALPSISILDGIQGAIFNLSGVTRVRSYDNDSGSVDANGIPGHSISIVAEGGDASRIAQTIAMKKTPGTGTYGTTRIMVDDVYGRSMEVDFFRPTVRPITATIMVKVLAGYSSPVGSAIQQAVSDYINGVEIGGGESGTVEWCDAIAAARSVANSHTFKITGLSLTSADGVGNPDVSLAFNEVSTCSPADVVLEVS